MACLDAGLAPLSPLVAPGMGWQKKLRLPLLFGFGVGVI